MPKIQPGHSHVPGFVVSGGVVVPDVELHQGDCLSVMKGLPDNSIDLIVTDPPYYKVKTAEWDNQWSDTNAFLGWLDERLAECWRLLKPNGSLYLFCSPKLVAETELLIKERFNVLNHIVWRKPSGRHKGCNKESLRRYFPQTERIIFAEHHNAERGAKQQAGYERQCQELKALVFEPLIQYFIKAKALAGISSKAINEATGTQMATHWFTYSQWKLPNAEQYRALQALFKARASSLEKPHNELSSDYSQLHRTYLELKLEYEELRQRYENLRRYFGVTKNVPYTDVWDFKPVEHYPGKHPCEKPLALIEHMIKSSARPGMSVLDPFMGSGVTGKAAVNHGCRFVGVERDVGIFRQARERLLVSV